MKQKIVCTNVKKSIRTGRKYKPWETVTRRYCREKYRKMETLPTKRYFRDDQKRCFENHKGVDIHFTKKRCGWYLNDRKKVSSDFQFLTPQEYVWRQD